MNVNSLKEPRWAVIHFPPRTSKDATQIPSHVPDVQEVGIKGADANGEEPDQKVRWGDVRRHQNLCMPYYMHMYTHALNAVKTFGTTLQLTWNITEISYFSSIHAWFMRRPMQKGQNRTSSDSRWIRFCRFWWTCIRNALHKNVCKD